MEREQRHKHNSNRRVIGYRIDNLGNRNTLLLGQELPMSAVMCSLPAVSHH
jgi:hypothetical protein